MASTLAANAAVDCVIKGAWLVVADGLAAWSPLFLCSARSCGHCSERDAIIMWRL